MIADTHHPDPLAIILNDQERERVADAIQQLPEKERLVFAMYYCEELTMKEIRRIINVTDSRVCQIHAKAVLHLRGRATRQGTRNHDPRGRAKNGSGNCRAE